jgi:cell wall-associated NlpC family hydrolase
LTGSVRRLGRFSNASIAAIGAIAVIVAQSPIPAGAVEPAPVVDPTPSADSTSSVDLTPSADLAPSVDPALIDPSPAVDPAVIDPLPALDAAPIDPSTPAPGDPTTAVVSAAAAPRPVIADRVSAAAAVVKAAESHLGARYRRGSTGPRAFDCSGLVYRAFAQVGLARRIDGLHSASALYAYFRRHHLASRRSPQVGDLVIWGHGAHVGIYIGHGRAISALVSGVRIHRVSAVLSGFTAYLHTHLSRVTVPARYGTSSRHSSSHHTVRRATTTLAVRVSAGSGHRRIATIHRGARLVVLGSRMLAHHRHWLHVRLTNGRTGWVAGWHTRA